MNIKKGIKCALVCLFSVCFLMSLLILWLAFRALYPPKMIADSEIYVANTETCKKVYEINKCDSMTFFSRGNVHFKEITPKVKIVNEDTYYVEIITDKEVFDILGVDGKGGDLFIDAGDYYYENTPKDDMGYEKCLYIDCSTFEVIVHSPISKFRSYTNIELDFETSEAGTVRLLFKGDYTKANVHHVMTDDLFLYSYGNADVVLGGVVKNYATLNVNDNSHVNTENLTARYLGNKITNAPFGLSKIQYDGAVEMNFWDMGTLDAIIRVALPLIWIYLIVLILRSDGNRRKLSKSSRKN